MRPRTLLLPLAVLALAATAHADEGMWPFDMVPRAQIQKDHGVALTDAWLDHVRLSTVRMSSGGTGSFVSRTGLLLTNHHVASDCIAKIASPAHNYMDDGFLAGRDGPEARCPDLAADVLEHMEDVTAKVTAARKPGMSDADANVAIKSAMGELEKSCTEKNKPLLGEARCEVVTLYAGAKYHLYTYKRYTDLRLVFAPEAGIAFFGGDPDNFTYPRFDLDMALFRAYEGGKAVALSDWLTWNPAGAKDGETVFVSGNPGRTGRLSTVSQLEQLRDTVYPYVIASLVRERDLLQQLGAQGHEYEREAREELFGVQNAIKALGGYEKGLRDPGLMKKKKDDEAALIKAIKADPKLEASHGTVFSDVARVQAKVKAIYRPYSAMERTGGSQLLAFARTLVRWADEKELPGEKRLREYQDANMDQVKLELFSSAPVYGAVEVVLVRAWMERLQRELANRPALLAKVLHGETPARAAQELVAGSRLFDVYARKQLFAGGKAAIAASDDPAIVLMRTVDPDARAIRKEYEDGVEAPMRKLGERVAQATFAVRGSSMMPDATFTLRLSVGVVKGYTENGKAVPFATDFDGMYAHATGKDPYKLPPRWLEKKAAIRKDTKLDFVSTDDIIGGNSGSPVVDAKGQLVGLIFDGNLSSLPNNFVYRDVTERAVSVDSAGMLEALRDVYDAGPLAREILGKP